MSELESEILGLISEAQSLVKQGKLSDSSLIVVIKELWTLLPKNTRKPSSESLCNYHDAAKSCFASTFYVSFTEFLIRNFTHEWLQGDSEDQSLLRFFSDFFLLGIPEDALKILAHAIVTMKESLCLYKLISLLESLLKQNCLRIIFSNYCLFCSSNLIGDTFEATTENERILIEQSAPLVSIVATLPDIVTPRLYLRGSSDFFYPQIYVQFVTREIITVLRTVYESMRQGKSCSVSVITELIAKLSMVGHGKLMWRTLLDELECTVVADYLWQRILQRIISRVPDRCIEQVVMPLIFESSSHRTLAATLGSLPATKEKLRFTLTHKLLLVRYLEETKGLLNVIGYLVSTESLWPTFTMAFKKLLNAWSDGSSLRHRPLEQSTYLSKAVLIFVAHLQRDKSLLTSDVKDTVLHTLLNGMAGYLDSSVTQIRKMGMVVGENLSDLVHSDGQGLRFDIETDDFVKDLQLLLSLPVDKTPESVNEDDSTRKFTEEISQKILEAKGEQSANEMKSCQTAAVDELDSDDDEDDLIPIASDPVSSKPSKSPFYLSECMEGLLSTDDPERFEQCLRHADRLIRRHPGVSEISAELCKILLHLDDHLSLPEFSVLRLKALVALTVSSPEIIAKYLTHEFYERNYNISQRLDMLDALSYGAKELSQLKSVEVNRDRDVAEAQPLLSETDWSGIIRARLESKTRRFAKGPKKTQPAPVSNRFQKVVGWFFYPLMSRFDQKESCVDLLGCDHIVLQHLLRTLGIVMYCALNTPNVGQMAKTLLEFTWCFRHHVQPAVRRVVLLADFTAISVVPAFQLASDLSAELLELREWLHEDVMSRDTDTECRTFAAQILVTLEDKLQQQMKSEDL